MKVRIFYEPEDRLEARNADLIWRFARSLSPGTDVKMLGEADRDKLVSTILEYLEQMDERTLKIGYYMIFGMCSGPDD